MIILILTSVVMATFFIFLPESFWAHLESRTKFLYLFSKKVFDFKSHTQGEALVREIVEIEAELFVSGQVKNWDLSRYKFYTQVLLRILDYARKYGASLKIPLLEMREALSKDLLFEKKIRKEFWGGTIQFALIAFVTWGFVAMSSYLLELHLSKKILFYMIILQLSGVTIYSYFFYYFRKKTFQIFEILYPAYYSLLILSEVGLSIKNSLQESLILNVLHLKDKRLIFIIARTGSLLERWQSKGVPLKVELKDLLLQIHALEEEGFQSFLKLIAILKFSVLCLSFLTAYFIYLSSLFHVFLIE